MASRKRLHDARLYIEREAGISRDELNALFPLGIFVDGEGASKLEKLTPFVFRGAKLVSVGIVVALSWPSPSVSIARGRLSALAVPIAEASAAARVEEVHLDLQDGAPSALPTVDVRKSPTRPVYRTTGTNAPFTQEVSKVEFRKR